MADRNTQRRQRKIEEIETQLEALNHSSTISDGSDFPVQAATKKPKRGRGGSENFPNAITDESADDVRRVLSGVLRWYKMPKASTDQEIAERTELFFDECARNGERPTVEKYCLALGYARNTVTEWKNGMHCSAERSTIIKIAFDCLSAYDAGMATEGKMNPVPYIFRAKNYYGMRDQTDLVVTPNNPLGETISVDAIEEKYQQLPED